MQDGSTPRGNSRCGWYRPFDKGHPFDRNLQAMLVPKQRAQGNGTREVDRGGRKSSTSTSTITSTSSSTSSPGGIACHGRNECDTVACCHGTQTDHGHVCRKPHCASRRLCCLVRASKQPSPSTSFSSTAPVASALRVHHEHSPTQHEIR